MKLTIVECNRNHALKVFTMEIGVIFLALNAAFYGALKDTTHDEKKIFFHLHFSRARLDCKSECLSNARWNFNDSFPLKRIAVVFHHSALFFCCETAQHCV